MPAKYEQPIESRGVPQLSEAESALVYDEMLRNGRIIQVASGGVRVFDKSGIFIRKEVLKAKRTFARIDITPGLERMVDHLMENDELKVSKVRAELYRSVYKPIKRTLDELVHDSRIFFGDSATLVQVRSDVQKVVQRLDLLTLGMLNDILTHSALEFRHHIEAGVYSGLAGSVVFGDYKRKLTDKKVVEDLIMLGIIHGLGPNLKKSTSFKELCRTSKSFYDVEKVLDEVNANPDEPTNMLSEILAVSVKYIHALDETEDRDPLDGLVAIMSACTERHAIGVGALARKYAINEYMINYLMRDEAFHERLRRSEDLFELAVRKRMERDPSPATLKLGEMFVRQLRFKRTIKLGSDMMHRLDDFIGVLLPVKAAADSFLERIAEIDRPEYVRLTHLTRTMSEAIDATLEFHEQHADPANWPDLANVPGAAYLIAYKRRPEIEYQVQHTVRVIQRCRAEAAELFGSNAEAVFRSAFDELDQQMATVDRFRATMLPQPVDVTRVLRAVGRLFSGVEGLRIAVETPRTPAVATIDPLGLDGVLCELLEAIAHPVGSGADRAGDEAGALPEVSISVRPGERGCFARIAGSCDAFPTDAASLQERLEKVAPGAVLRVNAEEGSGTTFSIEFPVDEQEQAVASVLAHA